MAFGKGYRRKDGGAPRILWEEGRQALRYLGQQIPIAAFQATARAALGDAKASIAGLFYEPWSAVEASVDLDRVVDTLLFEAPGASFLTNPANRWLEPGYQRLATRAYPALWDARAGRWRRGPVTAYLARVDGLRKAILLIAHV